MGDKVKSCQSCGASIVFMTQKPTNKNPQPKPNPINRFPSADGNLLVNWDNLTYQVVSKAELEKVKRLPNPPSLYKSHFGNCPDAKKYRRK